VGKIDILSGSRERLFTGADDPLLRGAIADPGFGEGGRIGVEIEFVVVEAATGLSLGMAGSRLAPGDYLRRVHAEAGPGAVLVCDPLNDYPCGVVLPNGGRFCLENGGQVEYASAPCASLAAVAAELAEALEVAERAAAGELAFLSHGTHPTLERRTDPLVPNSRYGIMERFFTPDSIHRWGNYACAIQVNLDVPGAEAWGEAYRLGAALSRIAYPLFANSAWLQGARVEGPSARMALTAGMDARRRHVPAAAVLAADPAGAYLGWALDVPVIFAGELPPEEQPRNGELTFRAWLTDGYKGQFPTYANWLMHLGTLWPDVRPRRFLELRATDAQPFEHVMAAVAFWQALIQRPEGRAAATARLAAAGGIAGILARDAADPAHADPALHAGLVALAREVLAAAGEERFAAALGRYAAFLGAKPAYWAAADAEAFMRTAATARPAEALRGEPA
jgi:glutamate--cysteine ligase